MITVTTVALLDPREIPRLPWGQADYYLLWQDGTGQQRRQWCGTPADLHMAYVARLHDQEATNIGIHIGPLPRLWVMPAQNENEEVLENVA